MFTKNIPDIKRKSALLFLNNNDLENVISIAIIDNCDSSILPSAEKSNRYHVTTALFARSCAVSATGLDDRLFLNNDSSLTSI